MADSSGIHFFSNVGFSDDGRQALVFTGYWVGWPGGGFDFVLLEFDDQDGWREVARGPGF